MVIRHNSGQLALEVAMRDAEEMHREALPEAEAPIEPQDIISIEEEEAPFLLKNPRPRAA